MSIKYGVAHILFLMLTGCASLGSTQQSQIERMTLEELAKLLPPPIATVTLNEIVVDSKQGKSPDEIIVKIKESNSRYELIPSQMLALNKQGVDAKVLDYIQKRDALAKQNAIATEMNRRQKEKALVQKQLNRERLARHRYSSPFWRQGYNFRHLAPIGLGGRYWRGSRFGWGLPYGRLHGW